MLQPHSTNGTTLSGTQLPYYQDYRSRPLYTKGSWNRTSAVLPNYTQFTGSLQTAQSTLTAQNRSAIVEHSTYDRSNPDADTLGGTSSFRYINATETYGVFTNIPTTHRLPPSEVLQSHPFHPAVSDSDIPTSIGRYPPSPSITSQWITSTSSTTSSIPSGSVGHSKSGGSGTLDSTSTSSALLASIAVVAGVALICAAYVLLRRGPGSGARNQETSIRRRRYHSFTNMVGYTDKSN